MKWSKCNRIYHLHSVCGKPIFMIQSFLFRILGTIDSTPSGLC